MTHTSGPWHNDHSIEITAGIKSICGMRYPFAQSMENAANARLIAAAPELLEILIKLCAIQEIGDVASWAPEWDCARAVITKATAP